MFGGHGILWHRLVAVLLQPLDLEIKSRVMRSAGASKGGGKGAWSPYRKIAPLPGGQEVIPSWYHFFFFR